MGGKSSHKASEATQFCLISFFRIVSKVCFTSLRLHSPHNKREVQDLSLWTDAASGGSRPGKLSSWTR